MTTTKTNSLMDEAIEDAQVPAVVFSNLHEDSNEVTAVAVTGSDGEQVFKEGHFYEVWDATKISATTPTPDFMLASIIFQNGPVKEVGVNGVTSEALLAILIHRTALLQQQFPCNENLQALTHMSDALAHLEARTYRRQLRQVEGKNKA